MQGTRAPKHDRTIQDSHQPLAISVSTSSHASSSHCYLHTAPTTVRMNCSCRCILQIPHLLLPLEDAYNLHKTSLPNGDLSYVMPRLRRVTLFSNYPPFWSRDVWEELKNNELAESEKRNFPSRADCKSTCDSEFMALVEDNASTVQIFLEISMGLGKFSVLSPPYLQPERLTII